MRNSFIQRLTAILVLTLFTLPVFACSKTDESRLPKADVETMSPAAEENQPAQENQSSEKEPAKEDETLVVARVNGEEILLGSLIRQTATTEMIFSSIGDMSDEEKTEKINSARLEALDLLIMQTIIEQKTAEYGIVLSDEDIARIKETVDAKIKSVEDYVLKTYPDLAEEELNETVEGLLKAQGMNYDLMIENLTKGVLEDRLYNSVTADIDITVADEDIRKAYASLLEEQQSAFDKDVAAYETALLADEVITYRPVTCKKVSQFYMMYDEDVIGMINQLRQYNSDELANEMIADQQTRMKEKVETAQQLLANGGDFFKLQSAIACNGAYSINYIGDNTTRFSEAYRNEVKKLKNPGDVSLAIPADWGVYILKLEGILQPEEVPLQEVSALLGARLLEEKRVQAYKDLQAEWLALSTVEKYEENVYTQ